jgi:hypothetical protein
MMPPFLAVHPIVSGLTDWLALGIALLTFLFLVWRLIRPMVLLQRRLFEIASRELDPSGEGDGTSVKEHVEEIKEEQDRTRTELLEHRERAAKEHFEIRDLVLTHIYDLNMHIREHEEDKE